MIMWLYRNERMNTTQKETIKQPQCLLKNDTRLLVTHKTKTHVMGWTMDTVPQISVYAPLDRVKKWL
jgi:hypothetical protein